MRRLLCLFSLVGLVLVPGCDDGGGGEPSAVDMDALADGTDAVDATDAETGDVADAVDAMDAEPGDGVAAMDAETGDGADTTPPPDEGVDECTTGEASCGTNAACHDLPAGYACRCLAGFAGDGQACAPLALTAIGTSGRRSCALADDGTLRCWGLTLDPNPILSEIEGDAHIGRPQEVAGASDSGWQQLDMSNAGICSVRGDGTLWCHTAAAAQGAVGTDSDWSHVSTGAVNLAGGVGDGLAGACGLRGDGQLWCWWFGFGPDRVLEPNTMAQIEPDLRWRHVTVGAGFTCAVRDDQTLWCWGNNDGGQLGVGDTMDRDAPTQVGTATDWVEVVAGRAHVCGLRGGGQLWCWGSNPVGVIGDGSRDDRHEPVAVAPERTFRQVELAELNTCAVAVDGTLWCWGANGHHQLGVENLSSSQSPVQVGSATDWLQVAPAATHTCAVRADGSAWCWGTGELGQLGLGLAPSQALPAPVVIGADWHEVAVGTHHACGLRAGQPWCWGTGLAVSDNALAVRADVPVALELAGRFEALTAGSDNSCALRDDGQLWCWGGNAHGEAGIGALGSTQGPQQVAEPATWLAVDMGSAHTCGIAGDGLLWCWGSDSSGQLGDGAAGSDGSSVPVAVEGGGWVSVSGGGPLGGAGHSCAIADDQGLWCWGNNGDGQLGDGTRESRDVPVEIAAGTRWLAVSAGARHTCGVQADGSLWCWGENDARQLGLGEADPALEPNRVGSDTGWEQVSAGGAHTCALRAGGELYCWGSDGLGQTGSDPGFDASASTPQRVAAEHVWLRVRAGRESTCAVREGHTLWCWGSGTAGQGGHDMAFAEQPERVIP